MKQGEGAGAKLQAQYGLVNAERQQARAAAAGRAAAIREETEMHVVSSLLFATCVCVQNMAVKAQHA